MDDRIMQFRVGVVVLGVSLIAGVMTLLFGHFPGKHYTIYVDFRSAPGVAAGTPIKESGVLIGRVTGVSLREDNPVEPVQITAEIESQYKIRHNQTIQVSNGLLGDAELDVVDLPAPRIVPAATPSPGQSAEPAAPAEPTIRGQSGDEAPPAPATPPEPGVPVPKPAAPALPPATFIQPGETIKGESGASPTQEFAKLEDDMSKVSNSLSAASDEVRVLAHNINGLLGHGDSERLRRLVDKTESSMDAMQRTLNDVDKIVGDPQMQADMKQSLANLPGTLKQMQQSFQSLQQTTALADQNLKNLQGFTQPLSDSGPEMVNHANHSIRELDELLGQFTQFGRGLNSSQGTLGQLINNQELYQQLTEAACNINELTHRLQPILNDVRDFTDKIARHPEVLGVRGAIDRSPGIK
jgi:phospholipid/cholesterol/gamma-HCH transport system substrate-binding protein